MVSHHTPETEIRHVSKQDYIYVTRKYHSDVEQSQPLHRVAFKSLCYNLVMLLQDVSVFVSNIKILIWASVLYFYSD